MGGVEFNFVLAGLANGPHLGGRISKGVTACNFARCTDQIVYQLGAACVM